jgi:transposase-like protein
MSNLPQSIQPDLINIEPGEELLFPEAKARRVFTGEVVARNQEKYRAIVEAIAGGHSCRDIAHRFGVSKNVVTAIRGAEPDLVGTEKKRLSRKLGTAVELGVEAWIESLQAGTLKPESIPVGVGILFDKRALIEGEPTARVEHVDTKIIRHEDINAYIDALPSVVDVQPSDSTSESSTTKAQQIEG